MAELLDDNRLIIWDIADSRRVYNDGFYGEPLGDPRPKEDFDDPLLLDPVEALYLVQQKKIKVHKQNNSIGMKKLRELGEKTFSRFNEKYRVYSDLRKRGFVVTPGIKYGCDFAVYESGPGIDHAPYVVQIMDSKEELSASEIVKAGRLATTVRKSFILAIINEDIRYLEFNWWKA
ncbi:tRNA-intron lyase [Candidatus Bathyarchaeota archaeon]|nr:MAG: tRNA-intron lyase [Candidatus Bathyarchaeota archaeon]